MISNILSWIIFLPVIGAVLVLLVPRSEKQTNIIRAISAVFTGLQVVLAVFIFINFDRNTSTMQMVEQVKWIPSYNIWYFIGIDGLSVSMVLLTALLSFICIFASWGIERAVKGYFALFLLLDTGMMGVFCALDFFLFYVFWEIMLLPMYFLIGIWGGPRREYAAIKFFLYTLLGSVLMLIAMLVFYFNVKDPVTGGHTFNMLHMMDQTLHQGILSQFNVRLLVFAALYIGFAIKIPAFPFHTWLPDAHVEAPTAISVILAGVLLKMGTYGFLRFCLPLFPVASLAFAPWIFLLALVGILYGAWVSMVQPDLKKLVAYSSVSHLGFVVLGLFTLTPQGIVGGILQMVNHGLSTGALFLLVGVLYERRHTRLIADFGGLWQAIPAFSALFLIVALSSLGLPGLNGFVGEFLILLGSFAWAAHVPAGGPLAYLVPILATSGILFAAVYLLWMYQRVCFGEVTREANRGLSDLTGREWAVLLPILFFIVWIGVYPRPFTGVTEATAQALIAQVEVKAAATVGPGSR